MNRLSLSSGCLVHTNQPCNDLPPLCTASTNGPNCDKCTSKVACSSKVPESNSMTRKRRSPVLLNVCLDCLPSLVTPVADDIGEGTISARRPNWPRQCSRDFVSNTCEDSPQHNNGLPGNRTSITDSL